MRKSLLFCLLSATAVTAAASDWSVGAGTGPFAFGRFLERTLRASTDAGTKTSLIRLSASTRPGLALDLERRLSDAWSVRIEASGTQAPVEVRDESGQSVSLEAGKIDIGTLMLPLVLHVNRKGAVRVDLYAGPAHAVYHIRRRTALSGGLALFEGTRTRWGAAGGLGVAWWWRPRFAVEGRATDMVTASPFRRSDFPAGATAIRILKPHNIHVTGGIRYTF